MRSEGVHPVRFADMWTSGGAGLLPGILSGALKRLVSTLNFFKEGYEMFAPVGVLN